MQKLASFAKASSFAKATARQIGVLGKIEVRARRGQQDYGTTGRQDYGKLIVKRIEELKAARHTEDKGQK